MEERNTQPKFQLSKLLLVLVLMSLISTSGCNLYGRLDQPRQSEDFYAAGVAAANDGRCDEAVNWLKSIDHPNDDAYSALGWAYLCVGGATAINIATSLYRFSSTSSNYTVVGALARSMLPRSGAKSQALSKASDTFEFVQDPTRRSVEIAITRMVLAADVLANQSSNDGDSTNLALADVSDTGCAAFASSCASVGASCQAVMGDTATTQFTNLITAAAVAMNATGATDLQALANGMQSGLAGSTNVARCFIYNKMIP